MRVSLTPVTPRILVTIACLVLTAAGLSACKTTPYADPSVDYCTIVADPPKKDGSRLAGPGHYLCAGSGADSITITLRLQKQNSKGNWADIGKSGTFTAKGADTTSDRIQATRTHQVTASCSSGEFRTTLHAVEKSKGHSHSYDYHSVGVKNPCH